MKFKVALDLFNSWDWQNDELYKGFTVGKGKRIYHMISNVKVLTSLTKTVAVYRSEGNGTIVRRYVPVNAPITLIKA